MCFTADQDGLEVHRKGKIWRRWGAVGAGPLIWESGTRQFRWVQIFGRFVTVKWKVLEMESCLVFQKEKKKIYSEKNVVRKNRGNSLLSYIPDQRGDDRGPNLCERQDDV